MQQTDLNKSGLQSEELKIPQQLQDLVSSQQLSQANSAKKEQPGRFFHREIDNFYCDFTLTHNETIKIVLSSAIDASVFQLQLNREQKKSQEDLNFFQSIEEIFEYIQDNTGQSSQNGEERLVKIDQIGKLSLMVISTIGKKERQKEIFMQTKRVEEQREVYLENLIKRISQNLVELRNEVGTLRQKQQSFENQSGYLLQKLKGEGEKLQFRWGKGDPHSQKFKFLQKRVTKASDDTSYFSVMSEVPVNKKGVSYFHIKIVSSSQKNVIVGVGSKFIRGIQNAYTHPDFIGFYSFGEGYIWQKTNQRQLKLASYPIQNGTVITTIIDMDLGHIVWEICRVKVAYAVIPLQLKAKLLLPTVMMINVNDTVMFP